MRSPIAQNGIVPTISTAQMIATCASESVILPARSAATATSVTAMAATPIDISTFATIVAPGGSGSARLSFSRLPSRSVARITPLKMPGMAAASTAKPANR